MARRTSRRPDRYHAVVARSVLDRYQAKTGESVSLPVPIEMIIESINQTLKGQLSLERHKGRTRSGVAVRIGARLLALTAAFWHNETYRHTRPARSLTAYDH